MKKLILTMLALVLCISMFACDEDDAAKNKNDTTTTTATTTTTTTTTTATTTTKEDINTEPEAPECTHQYSSEGKCTLCGAADPDYVEPSEGLSYRLNTDGAAYSVVSFGTCSDTAIVIPSQYKGLPVMSIGERAFSNHTGLESITIPDSVTAIGEGAFNECTSLESITIPNSVTAIGEGAFTECISLMIYCECGSQPDTWEAMWNVSDCPVVWGYTGEE